MGIYTTEAELAELAKTDESGTSLWNLKKAAESKGISAVGVRLSSDELQANYLVVLDIDGVNHFEVIKSINSMMVVLFDPNLGLIEMTRAKFDELYIGVAMIFGGSAPVNATLLTQAEMEEIKANGYMKMVARSYWVPGYVYVTYKSRTVSYSLPYVYWVYVPGYTVRSWYTLWQTVHIPGHSEPRIGWRTYHYTFWYPVLHYVPPRKVTYYTYQYVPDVKVPVVKVKKLVNTRDVLERSAIRLSGAAIAGGAVATAGGVVAVGVGTIFTASGAASFGITTYLNPGKVGGAFSDPWYEWDIGGFKFNTYGYSPYEEFYYQIFNL